MAREGGCTLIASAYAPGEARDNLLRKAPHALPRFEELVTLADGLAELLARVLRSG